MLFINKKFDLSVLASDSDKIEEKLKEFGIMYVGPRYHGMIIHDNQIVKVHFDCQTNEDELEKLKTYLQDEFKGISSITF